MILKSKICGVTDSDTLNYIVNHKYPSEFIGFIVNYPKSKRYIDKNNLKKLLSINKIEKNFISKFKIEKYAFISRNIRKKRNKYIE